MEREVAKIDLIVGIRSPSAKTYIVQMIDADGDAHSFSFSMSLSKKQAGIKSELSFKHLGWEIFW